MAALLCGRICNQTYDVAVIRLIEDENLVFIKCITNLKQN
jgi:hypothetical protein